jgi:hypothetical protein
MYDKYTHATLITPSAGTKLTKHKAVMLLNNTGTHRSTPDAFKVIDKSGAAVSWTPTAPGNASQPFTIIPIQVYSYEISVAATVSVYLLN